MVLYLWMIDECGVVEALKSVLRASLFDYRPEHRLSWMMFLANVLSSFWRMKERYFNQVTTASSQSLYVYRTQNIAPLDAIIFKILSASLINLYKLYTVRYYLLLCISVCTFLEPSVQCEIIVSLPSYGVSVHWVLLVIFQSTWTQTSRWTPLKWHLCNVQLYQLSKTLCELRK
jgi:hypothetical protein